MRALTPHLKWPCTWHGFACGISDRAKWETVSSRFEEATLPATLNRSAFQVNYCEGDKDESANNVLLNEYSGDHTMVVSEVAIPEDMDLGMCVVNALVALIYTFLYEAEQAPQTDIIVRANLIHQHMLATSLPT